MIAHNVFNIPGAKVTLPSRSVFDPRFKPRDSSKTDVRLSWRKARLYMRLNGIEPVRVAL